MLNSITKINEKMEKQEKRKEGNLPQNNDSKYDISESKKILVNTNSLHKIFILCLTSFGGASLCSLGCLL